MALLSVIYVRVRGLFVLSERKEKGGTRGMKAACYLRQPLLVMSEMIRGSHKLVQMDLKAHLAGLVRSWMHNSSSRGSSVNMKPNH
jgi:hypothetical protein